MNHIAHFLRAFIRNPADKEFITKQSQRHLQGTYALHVACLVCCINTHCAPASIVNKPIAKHHLYVCWWCDEPHKPATTHDVLLACNDASAPRIGSNGNSASSVHWHVRMHYLTRKRSYVSHVLDLPPVHSFWQLSSHNFPKQHTIAVNISFAGDPRTCKFRYCGQVNG